MLYCSVNPLLLNIIQIYDPLISIFTNYFLILIAVHQERPSSLTNIIKSRFRTKMSNMRMVTSRLYTAPLTFFNFTSFREACSKKGITLTKYSDSQLESTYSMQGFKASGERPNQICFVFISLLEDAVLPVSTYYNGTLIFSKNLTNQAQILELIQKSFEVVRSNFADGKKTEEEYRELQRLFDSLDKTSQKILKKETNEMMAVQEIKSSNQYMAICKFAQKISTSVADMCKAAKMRENKSRFGNENIVKQMIAVEEEKEKVQACLFKYNEIMKQVTNVDSILTNLIAKKKEQQVTDFSDEETFLKYLNDLKQIKKLENQKKYLSQS